RGAVDGVQLTVVGHEPDNFGFVRGAQRVEESAGLDRAVLVRIADQLHRTTGGTDMAEQLGEVTSANHRCLVDDQDDAIRYAVPAKVEQRARNRLGRLPSENV